MILYINYYVYESDLTVVHYLGINYWMLYIQLSSIAFTYVLLHRSTLIIKVQIVSDKHQNGACDRLDETDK